MSQHDEVRREIYSCLGCGHILCRCSEVQNSAKIRGVGEGAGMNVGAALDDRHTFASGAMSSGKKPRYDLIPLWALERIARRFELGAIKYGEDNWQKGARDRDFIIDRINHAIEHLYLLCELVKNDQWTDDDDAAAVILNSIFVMGWQRAKDLEPGGPNAAPRE